ncbi:MAG: hypothetical protein ABIO46_13530 [Chitinophagales bacterium]
MSDYRRISELNAKISNLLEAVGNNGGSFSSIDKDLVSNYMRELYELIVAIKPFSKPQVPTTIEVKPVIEEKKVEEIMELPHQEEIVPLVVKEVKIEPEIIPDKPESEIRIKEKPIEQKQLLREVKKTLVESGSKKSISELYAEKGETDKSTLNDKYKSQGKEIADTLKHTPIKDLKAYIGLNKRFTFINALFNGREQQYDTAISKVNSQASYEEALNYLQQEVMPEYKWKDEETAVSEFFTLVMRRYLS